MFFLGGENLKLTFSSNENSGFCPLANQICDKNARKSPVIGLVLENESDFELDLCLYITFFMIQSIGRSLAHSPPVEQNGQYAPLRIKKLAATRLAINAINRTNRSHLIV